MSNEQQPAPSPVWVIKEMEKVLKRIMDQTKPGSRDPYFSREFIKGYACAVDDAKLILKDADESGQNKEVETELINALNKACEQKRELQFQIDLNKDKAANWDKLFKENEQLQTENENLKKLLHETAARCQIIFPTTEDSLAWFEQGLDAKTKVGADFQLRLHEALKELIENNETPEINNMP